MPHARLLCSIRASPVSHSIFLTRYIIFVLLVPIFCPNHIPFITSFCRVRIPFLPHITPFSTYLCFIRGSLVSTLIFLPRYIIFVRLSVPISCPVPTPFMPSFCLVCNPFLSRPCRRYCPTPFSSLAILFLLASLCPFPFKPSFCLIKNLFLFYLCPYFFPFHFPIM